MSRKKVSAYDKPAATGFDDNESQELADLRSENKELRTELAELREQRHRVGRLALAGGGFAARIVVGQELTRAIKRWLEAKTLANPLPVEETADVAAAAVRRWLRVGLWHLMLSLGGVVTAGILIWQSLLISDQIKEQQNQNELVRWAQLLDRIHDRGPGWRRALVMFVEIERSRNITPDLSGANFDGAKLKGIDFSKMNLHRATFEKADFVSAKLSESDLSWAILSKANLSDADLSKADLSDATLSGTILSGKLIGADLSRADLSWANLSQADLQEADLSQAYLHNANFSQADLRRADLSRTKTRHPMEGAPDFYDRDLGETDFRGADLRGADLRGADLSRARNLTQQQLDSALGDKATKLPELPEDLKMPKSWLK